MSKKLDGVATVVNEQTPDQRAEMKALPGRVDTLEEGKNGFTEAQAELVNKLVEEGLKKESAEIEKRIEEGVKKALDQCLDQRGKVLREGCGKKATETARGLVEASEKETEKKYKAHVKEQVEPLATKDFVVAEDDLVEDNLGHKRHELRKEVDAVSKKIRHVQGELRRVEGELVMEQGKSRRLKELKEELEGAKHRARAVDDELGMDGKGRARNFRAVERVLGMDEEGTAHKFRAVKGDVGDLGRRTGTMEEALGMDEEGTAQTLRAVQGDVIDVRQRTGTMEKALEMRVDGSSGYLSSLNANH